MLNLLLWDALGEKRFTALGIKWRSFLGTHSFQPGFTAVFRVKNITARSVMAADGDGGKLCSQTVTFPCFVFSKGFPDPPHPGTGMIELSDDRGSIKIVLNLVSSFSEIVQKSGQAAKVFQANLLTGSTAAFTDVATVCFQKLGACSVGCLMGNERTFHPTFLLWVILP